MQRKTKRLVAAFTAASVFALAYLALRDPATEVEEYKVGTAKEVTEAIHRPPKNERAGASGTSPPG